MDWSGYEFTSDWFTEHLPVWEPLLAEAKPARILEIGSYEGHSACALIELCGAERPVSLWCVDVWWDWGEGAGAQVEERFDRNINLALSRTAHQVTVHKTKWRSAPALAALIAQEGECTMDFIYVDGSHTAPDTLSDLVMAFHLLKVGGVMVVDDYLWVHPESTRLDILDTPKLGIDAFFNTFGRKMQLIRDLPLYQLYARKVEF